MRIDGKKSLVVIIPILTLLSGFGLVTFVYEQSDILYEVELTRISADKVYIWGNVELTITNNRDSQVGFTDIKIQLLNPKTNNVFFTYNNMGGTLEHGQSTSYDLSFKILITDIPDTDIVVQITGWLLWESERTYESKTIQVPISWEF